MNTSTDPNSFPFSVPISYLTFPGSTDYCNQTVIPTNQFQLDNYKRHMLQQQTFGVTTQSTGIQTETSGNKDDSHAPPTRTPRKSGRYKGHDCEICGKNFRQKTVLKTHMKVHCETKDFCCPVCKREFTYKANMDVHMRVHSGAKPHKCMQCDKCFSQANSLKYHMSIHTGYKPYACPTCKKAFVTKANLRDHAITHSSEKPFSCEICNNTFARKISLQAHYQTHSDNKPYKCKYCENSYAAVSSLNYHNTKHCGPNSRDFKNHVSSNSNSTSSSLEDAKHEEDIDFDVLVDQELLEKVQGKGYCYEDADPVCSNCGKVFRYQFAYLKHTQTCFSNNSNRFSCMECNQIFNDGVALNLHKSQHRLDRIAAEQIHQENLAHDKKFQSNDNYNYRSPSPVYYSVSSRK